MTHELSVLPAPSCTQSKLWPADVARAPAMTPRRPGLPASWKKNNALSLHIHKHAHMSACLLYIPHICCPLMERINMHGACELARRDEEITAWRGFHGVKLWFIGADGPRFHFHMARRGVKMGAVTYSHRLSVLLASAGGNAYLPLSANKCCQWKKKRQDHLVQITSALILNGFLFMTEERWWIYIYIFWQLIKGTHTYVRLPYQTRADSPLLMFWKCSNRPDLWNLISPFVGTRVECDGGTTPLPASWNTNRMRTETKMMLELSVL